VKRPSLHQRNRALRNLRSGPAFLTESRVAGVLDWLVASRAPAPAGDIVAPIAPPNAAAVPAAVVAPSKPKRARRAPKPLVVAPVTPTLSRVTFRIRRAKRAAEAVSVRIELVQAVELAQQIGNAARIHAAMRAALPDTPVPIVVRSAVVPSKRPAVRIVGVQNGAAAIHWLRTHGVSVKAASTTVLGTKYLVSNEFGEQNIAAVVAIARRKGFEG
jgi:hypothetical protein